MKRILLAALLGCACHKAPGKPPVIVSFTVDNVTPAEGDSITFSYQVTGATSVRIDPLPGPVTSSPVTVMTSVGGDFTLQAQNGAGSVQQIITITVKPALPVSVDQFTALPGQAAAGTDVTLSWKVTSASGLSLSDGSSNPPRDVTGLTSIHVNPLATTVYTLTAQAKPNHTPASASATAVARVAQPLTVSSFTAAPSTINQGDAAMLSWDGTATSWAVTDGTTGVTVNRGPLKSLTVRPSVTTTYTLIATGRFGTFSPAPVTVTVTPNPASTLKYTPPTVSGQTLQLIALPCSPCSSMTLSLVATGATSLRGVALDVPLDATKMQAPSGLGSFVTDSTPAAALVLGSGPLQNVLVFAAALKGNNGTAVASDVSFTPSAEVAHFVLTVQPQGGVGVVFDGTTPTGSAAIQSFIQSASGRTQGMIAVGKLEAQ